MTEPKFDPALAGEVETLDGRKYVGTIPLEAAVGKALALPATQVRFPGRAVLRTIVQVGIPAVVSVVAVIPLIIEAVIGYVPEAVRLWLLAVGAGFTAASAAIARVMAIPAVNVWLRKIGLSAQPLTVDALPGSTGQPMPIELAHAEPISRLDELDGVGRHAKDEPGD